MYFRLVLIPSSCRRSRFHARSCEISVRLRASPRVVPSCLFRGSTCACACGPVSDHHYTYHTPRELTRPSKKRLGIKAEPTERSRNRLSLAALTQDGIFLSPPHPLRPVVCRAPFLPCAPLGSGPETGPRLSPRRLRKTTRAIRRGGREPSSLGPLGVPLSCTCQRNRRGQDVTDSGKSCDYSQLRRRFSSRAAEQHDMRPHPSLENGPPFPS